jgi:hypothetical protein
VTVPNGALRTPGAALLAARRECKALGWFVSALIYRTEYGYGFALYDSATWHEIHEYGSVDRDVDGTGIPVLEATVRLAVEVAP